MWWQQPFVQVALPIIIMFAIATWFQNKRIDEVSKRLDDLGARVDKRLDDLRNSINTRLEAIEARLARIENLLTDHDAALPRSKNGPLHCGVKRPA